jgi:site-specific DNA-methyltransferase (adenine-specific)
VTLAFEGVLSGDQRWHVEHGDNLTVLRSMPDACVDAIVTDPPAGIGFMGKEWDDFRRSRNPGDVGRDSVFGRASARGPEIGRRDRNKFVSFLSEILAECYRVTKPGGRMLCWSIPRTMHWTGCAIEDAGWEIENTVAHIFGSGFPKAKSQLKPAREDWWLARKPAKNVLPLNIDACRVGGAGRWPANLVLSHGPNCRQVGVKQRPGDARRGGGTRPGGFVNTGSLKGAPIPVSKGYAEADGKETVEDWQCGEGCPVSELDRLGGHSVTGNRSARSKDAVVAGTAWGTNNHRSTEYPGESGGAARFFNTFEADQDDLETALFVYQAKASRADRNAGEANNSHPTVKSTPLMRHLVRLVAKPGSVVLDAFCGSGSTGRGAILEGCRFIGVEREDTENEPYVTIARRRIAAASSKGDVE